MNLKEINNILDEVSLIDPDEKPYNLYMVQIPILLWHENKKAIIRECLKRDDIMIELNAGYGGGMKPGYHIFAFKKSKNLPAITDEAELLKNIEELASVY